MAVGTFAVVTIGLSLLIILWLLDQPHLTALAGAALLFSLASTYNSTLSGVQNAARKRGIVAFHNGLDAWLKIVLAVALVIWVGRSSTVVLSRMRYRQRSWQPRSFSFCVG